MTEPPRSRKLGQGIAMGAVAGQAGCAIVVLVLVGLGLGIWLDGQLGTRPLLTITLTLLSIPLSLVYAVSSILSMARAVQSAHDQTPSEPGAELKKERHS